MTEPAAAGAFRRRRTVMPHPPEKTGARDANRLARGLADEERLPADDRARFTFRPPMPH